MKISLFIGILIYFGSRWILDRGKSNGSKEKIFFSYILLFVEIATIFAVIVQLLCNIAKWDLPTMVRWVGLALFISGVLLSVYSRIVLGSAYSTARNFSKPNRLIQYRSYRYIRHPIYSGTLLMGLGFELAVASYLFFAVFTLGAVVIYLCSREEERRLIKWFPEYRDYQRRTKKFIPFIF